MKLGSCGELACDVSEGGGPAGSSSFASALADDADNLRSRLAVGCGLVLLQQFSGQPNIIYYAADVFKQVGFCTEFASTLASVGLGFMKVASTVVSLNLVDRIGRRPALLSGISVMAISVFVMSTFAFYQVSKSASFSKIS